MNKNKKTLMWVIIISVVVILAIYMLISSLSSTQSTITFDQFVVYVEQNTLYIDESGEVSYDGYILDTADYQVVDGEIVLADGSELVKITKVDIDSYELYGYITNSSGSYVKTYIAIGPSLYSANAVESDTLLSRWIANGIKITYVDPNSGSIWSSIFSLGGTLLICVVFWLLLRSSMSAGAKGMSFGKSKARVQTNLKIRFSDVAGAEEEKVELAEIVEFLKHPKKFSDLGARIPRGCLLIGPPGTGKTLFAKAVAGESGVPFFSVSGSDFVELYVGMGASRVRDLFEMAKKNAPCIVFIDEIDAVGRHRGAGLGGGNDEREQTLNQILVQMDGFESNEGVIVLAATNRADILDPALLRPGRFDRQIRVNLPDVKGREMILKVHARNKPLSPDVSFKTIARMTSGFSGADLENLLNEASILAARANKKFVTNLELYEGINKVIMGPQKRSHIITESDKRITAYHEAGHAILARLLEHCDAVQEVSIIPRGGAAGYTLTRPDNDDKHISKNKLNDFICMVLGGRVAEELVIHDICTGASSDLQRATQMARSMVTEWGMSEKVGLCTYGSEGQTVFLGKDMETKKAYSETMATLIDSEMNNIVNNAHTRATDMLTTNRSILDNMARVLIEKETIYTDEIDLLMQGKSHKEVCEFMETHDDMYGGNPFKRYEKE